MQFNKIYLKKTGVFLAAYLAALVVNALLFDAFLLAFSYFHNPNPSEWFELAPLIEILFVTTLIGGAIGAPFALIGMIFYIVTDMKNKKQKTRLFFIALLLGLVCFGIARLLGADTFLYGFFSALCPPLVYYFVLLGDRKFIQ